jgi:hypothetical protein
VSLLGLASVTVARDEGLELNRLGLGFGIDVDDRILRLPGFSRLLSGHLNQCQNKNNS